jgi:hypothetical protein
MGTPGLIFKFALHAERVAAGTIGAARRLESNLTSNPLNPVRGTLTAGFMLALALAVPSGGFREEPGLTRWPMLLCMTFASHGRLPL